MLEWRIEEGIDLDTLLNGEILDVWSRDQLASPFCSPAFSRELVSFARIKGWRPFATRGVNQEGKTVVVWLLCKDQKGVLRFLQDEGYDHCVCLHLSEASVQDIGMGLSAAIQYVQPSSIFLTCIPPWSATLQAAQLCLEREGWKQKAFPAWACPVFGVDPGPEAKTQLLAKANSKKQLRTDERKLNRRYPGYAFEAFQDADNLEEWTREFCDCHAERWKNTSSPSTYESYQERERFLRTLKAWHQDGVLIRFSIRLSIGRVGFAVGLRSGNRMIYHHVAQNPQYGVGQILIRQVVLWMSEQGFSTLDFGTGSEAYKYRWANSDQKVWRVYGARSLFSLPYAKALLDQKLRSSEKLQSFWDEWVNRRIRGGVKIWGNLKNNVLPISRTAAER